MSDSFNDDENDKKPDQQDDFDLGDSGEYDLMNVRDSEKKESDENWPLIAFSFGFCGEIRWNNPLVP